jgi:hypothetical protein
MSSAQKCIRDGTLMMVPLLALARSCNMQSNWLLIGNKHLG